MVPSHPDNSVQPASGLSDHPDMWAGLQHPPAYQITKGEPRDISQVQLITCLSWLR
ncbi:hypothetical protein E2C01_063706 [Portunus trituberculatus]|uniref:Uncharacterized protein n=1 Tax=Portunus trituberculatus TaxID=210409 RepID=A0A5B7HB67_PORTR|nr:hypothetical protein [Portunus trituberculatus]